MPAWFQGDFSVVVDSVAALPLGAGRDLNVVPATGAVRCDAIYAASTASENGLLVRNGCVPVLPDVPEMA